MYALALQGGGVLGAAHLGVLRALLEADLAPAALAGTSAGAMAATAYAWRGELADVEALFADCQRLGSKLLDLNLGGIVGGVVNKAVHGNLTLEGLYKGDRLLRVLKKLFGSALMTDTKLPLAVTTVDVGSEQEVVLASRLARRRGTARWLAEGSLAEAVRASTAIPGVFCPVHKENMVLVDGGVVEVLPVTTLQRLTHQPVLAVALIGGEKPTAPPDDVVGILVGSLGTMQRRLEQTERSAAQAVLRVPMPPEAGVFSFERMAEIERIGYNTAWAALPEIELALFGDGVGRAHAV